MSTTFLIIGMAGTGKSTFSARLNLWLSSLTELTLDINTGLNKDITLINLDPAIIKTKMPLNIDIREYFDIENIMKDYDLGPNGSVTTILNLFMLKWDGKISSKYSVIDTPGQIEAFVWSNGGKILVQKIIKENNYQSTEPLPSVNEEIEQITQDISKTSLGTNRSDIKTDDLQKTTVSYEANTMKDENCSTKVGKNIKIENTDLYDGSLTGISSEKNVKDNWSENKKCLEENTKHKCSERKEQHNKEFLAGNEEIRQFSDRAHLKNEDISCKNQENLTAQKEKTEFVDNNSSDDIAKNTRKQNNALKEYKGQLIILYMLDSKECSKPSVFMCNMLYALMIKMRFNVPIVLIFNKIDLAPVPIHWLRDYETFLEQLDQESMNSSLLSSMALHFEEYYSNFEFVGVSAETGQGKNEFFDCMEKMTGVEYQKYQK